MSKRHEPDAEQMVALREFALRYGRDRWKEELRLQWLDGTENHHNGSFDGTLLRQLRNNFGPEWLANFEFDEWRDGWI